MTTPPDTMPDDKSRELLELLDGMAETWCERFGIAEAVRSIPVNYPTKEFEDRTYALIIRHIKQAYAEGVYCGRISHVDLAAAREAALMACVAELAWQVNELAPLASALHDLWVQESVSPPSHRILAKIDRAADFLEKHAAIITEAQAQAQNKGGKDGQ